MHLACMWSANLGSMHRVGGSFLCPHKPFSASTEKTHFSTQYLTHLLTLIPGHGTADSLMTHVWLVFIEKELGFLRHLTNFMVHGFTEKVMHFHHNRHEMITKECYGKKKTLTNSVCGIV